MTKISNIAMSTLKMYTSLLLVFVKINAVKKTQLTITKTKTQENVHYFSKMYT